ncbi:MAG: MoaD/ThiS family protein, partial [Granulosicoccus sp.]
WTSTLRIELTLGGGFVKYLPEGVSGNRYSTTCADACSVAQLMNQLGIPEETARMAILNGNLLQEHSYPTAILSEGDELSIVPPIQAG